MSVTCLWVTEGLSVGLGSNLLTLTHDHTDIPKVKGMISSQYKEFSNF